LFLGVLQLDINGNPFVGVWCATNNNLAFVPQNATKASIRKIERSLKVEVTPCTIGGTNLVGSLVTANSNGAVITNFIEDSELALLEKHIKVGVLDHRLNASGNIVLANDFAALIHPDLNEKALKQISKTLEVDVFRGTIAGLSTVGAAAVVTNEGLLCHPEATDDEKAALEKYFQVPVEIGTANYGTPLIGACVIANVNGAITGFSSTGIELGRIESGLNLIDK
jgi:translation initiation factor 6